jgi:uncharacterized protein with HEPN domain
METEVAKRLFDALQAARRIRAFTGQSNFGQFAESELLRSAVERQFEIIGEALGKAAEKDPSLAEQMPDLPRIVGLRNRLIHGYDSVDDEIIWDIVQKRILPLIERLEDLLGKSGYPTEVLE